MAKIFSTYVFFFLVVQTYLKAEERNETLNFIGSKRYMCI